MISDEEVPLCTRGRMEMQHVKQRGRARGRPRELLPSPKRPGESASLTHNPQVMYSHGIL